MNAPTDQVRWHYYSYDRYGVSKSGSGAGSIPLDGLASLVYTNAQSQTVSNRITSTGYEYDPAGNQTRGETSSGVWRRYKYDSAGRLAVVTDDGGSPLETYSYGASNERLMTVYCNLRNLCSNINSGNSR
ncbi:MAG: RHS repeat domain-containing protein [Blastocatellales bacterium]